MYINVFLSDFMQILCLAVFTCTFNSLLATIVNGKFILDLPNLGTKIACP